MGSKLDQAASAAGTFTKASASALVYSAVPVAVVSLTMGMVLWLANNMLVVGSGR